MVTFLRRHWEYENLVTVDLVFNVDGKEVYLRLWDYTTFW